MKRTTKSTNLLVFVATRPVGYRYNVIRRQRIIVPREQYFCFFVFYTLCFLYGYVRVFKFQPLHVFSYMTK